MNCTREQYIGAILSISEYLNLPAYKTMLDTIGYTLPEVTKMLVYDMFLKQFTFEVAQSVSTPLSEDYGLIHTYVKEITEKGFVDFK